MLVHLSQKSTILTVSVPPQAEPLIPRPTICISKVSLDVGLVKNTVLISGMSLPSVSILILIRTSTPFSALLFLNLSMTSTLFLL